MTRGWPPGLAAAGVLVGLGAAGVAADDVEPAADNVERGEVIFKKCYACHSVVPGETGLTGPNLVGVVGRTVASERDFSYTDALEALPGQGYERWTQATLDAFLAAPEDFAPGTAMTFVGLPDPQERSDVIAYLARTPAGSDED